MQRRVNERELNVEVREIRGGSAEVLLGERLSV